METVLSFDNVMAFLTLTVLEIVLGIDNIVFILILSEKLPRPEQPRARKTGLALAMVMRIALLCSMGWVMKLTSPLATIAGHGISGRDLILLAGGLFLIAKSTHEIHGKLEGAEHAPGVSPKKVSFSAVLTQIMVLDLVFSLDSVITAVGMSNELSIMVLAVITAVLFMMAFAGPLNDFVHRHPTVKMLALSFLMLIGVMLIADGLHHHIPKGYIYFAMAFSVAVEALNLKVKSRAKPVVLHEPVL